MLPALSANQIIVMIERKGDAPAQPNQIPRLFAVQPPPILDAAAPDLSVTPDIRNA